jgi:serine/threonine protein kinase
MINFFASELSEFGYTYVREIGSGSYGKVHLVLSKQYHQYFAIKKALKIQNLMFRMNLKS